MAESSFPEPPDHIADKAMGIELEVIELGVQLEWADAQGRTADAESLRRTIDERLEELAAVVDGSAVHDAA